MKRPLLELFWGPSGKRLVVGDALVVAVLLGAAGSSLLPRSSEGRPALAEVEAGGKSATVLDLRRAGISEVRGQIGATRLEVREGRVRVVSSPCPRGICLHGGWIGEAGDMLVCLPNQVVIRIPGRGAGAPDALSR